MQTIGDIITPWIQYPFVLGCDVAGEVAAVGGGVTRFRVGDRVLGHAVGSDKQRNSAAEGAFQTYVVLLAHMASPLPETLSYEAGSVLPLGPLDGGLWTFPKGFSRAEPPIGGAPSHGKDAADLGRLNERRR